MTGITAGPLNTKRGRSSKTCEWLVDVAFHQHVPAPLAHTNHEKLDQSPGAFHWPNTRDIAIWAFSYSFGEPCGRSNQLIIYFMFFSS